MSKNRLQKYEKVLAFQQQQLDSAKQKIGMQQRQISKIQDRRDGLMAELDQIDAQCRTSQLVTLSNASAHEQSCHAMIAVQRKINSTRTELAEANEKLDYLLHSFREQNGVVKSWEKLVEKQLERQASTLLIAKMNLADEQYLTTRSIESLL